jgi:hypothetical protein
MSAVFVYKNYSNKTHVATNELEDIAVVDSEYSSNDIESGLSGATSSDAKVDQQQITSGIKSFQYLFEGKHESNTSNIVGHFGSGAFAWYVPEWLVNNWQMKPFRSEGMIFAPKFQDNIEDFGYIIFDVSTSTELNNAENSAYTKLNDIPKEEIIINEVVLNKHSGDMLNIIMETNTRIYHIVAYTRDFRRITDMYFMDGNGKTLEITFEAKSEFFPQFSDKIRNLVEGIGELKQPQG